MLINRENYEAYLLDLFEGELSPDQEQVLREFLDLNPDLDPGPDILDITLTPAETEFRFKDALRKGPVAWQINENNYEQFCIARLEGELDTSTEKELAEFLSANPSCAAEARLYELISLKPDKCLKFPGKYALRKKESGRILLFGAIKRKPLYQAVAVAATVVILLAGTFFMIENHKEQSASGSLSHEIVISESQGEAFAVGNRKSQVLDSGNTISGINTGSLNTTPLAYNEIANSKLIHGVITDEEVVEFKREPLLDYIFPSHLVVPPRVETSQSGPGITPLRLTFRHSEPESEYQNERSGPGYLINGVAGFLARTLDRENEHERLTLWDIADAGFRGINTIAGTHLRLEREYDQDGDLVSMAFSSGIIEIQRSTKTSRD